LVSEHSAANNAADAPSADQSGGAESALPLTTDVVCLVGEHAGDVGIASDSGDKDAEIADAIVLREAEKWEAYEFVITLFGSLEYTDGLPIKRSTPLIRMKGALIWYLSPR
jgi:hypothetical protein